MVKLVAIGRLCGRWSTMADTTQTAGLMNSKITEKGCAALTILSTLTAFMFDQ